MDRVKLFAFWFAAEFITFALVVANGRAYNQAHYAATIITDMLISANGFYIGKKFIESADNRGPWAMAGCTLGGGTGSIFAIWATVHLYGQ